jgi:hypothetical protein
VWVRNGAVTVGPGPEKQVARLGFRNPWRARSLDLRRLDFCLLITHAGHKVSRAVALSRTAW